MRWTSVNSDNLLRVAYTEKGKLLHVIFRKAPGIMYTYYNVSKKTYLNLLSAYSVGEFFHHRIRDVKRFTKGKPVR